VPPGIAAAAAATATTANAFQAAGREWGEDTSLWNAKNRQNKAQERVRDTLQKFGCDLFTVEQLLVAAHGVDLRKQWLRTGVAGALQTHTLLLTLARSWLISSSSSPRANTGSDAKNMLKLGT
jgi:hypothetical protein